MADTEQQVDMLQETDVPHAQVLVENNEIMTVVQTSEVDNVGMGEDILQQALDEASGGYDNTDVEYTTEENIAVVADGNGTLSDANGVTYSYVTAVPTETQLETQAIPQTIPTAHTTQPGQSLIRITPNTQARVAAGVGSVVTLPQSQTRTIVANQRNANEQHCQQPQVVQVVRQPHVVQQVVQPQTTIQTNIIEGISPQPVAVPQIQQTHVQLSQTDAGTPGSITVLTNSGVGGEPLGSSKNPIRIIQQGNKYTSVQQLTPEQVAQIMQVVQQQQLAQTTKAGGGSSVLFNPQTQTRIVYRVIYPSELHSKTTGAPGTIVTAKTTPKTITVPTQMLTLGSSRRPYRKRLKEDDEKVDGPILTREEKEMRKKHRPRTRSGRVSRPPKHMVQDYKHIHHLDWEEDQDDSDGGYSDYKVTDDEDGEKRGVLDSTLLDTNINSSKPKKFSCEKCDKAYIGAAGLARHYRLNPDHGNPLDVCPLVGKGKLSINGGDGIASLADDSSTQDSISSTASLPTTMASVPVISTPITLPIPTTTETLSTEDPAPTLPSPNSVNNVAIAPTSVAPVVLVSPSKTTAPRGAVRAKQHYIQENSPSRRKLRLKELVRQCTDEELMEVVLPRLSRVITTWEFLLMKVERGRLSRPNITDMLTEYEALHKQVEKMCGDYLHPLPVNIDGHVERHTNVLQMKNPVIAESLGLNMGKYSVREVPKRDDSTFQYKLLTTIPISSASQTVQGGPASDKRVIQLVTPNELVDVDNPAKRQRIGEPCITAVSESSGIATVSLANGKIQLCVQPAEQSVEQEFVPASDSKMPSFVENQDESINIPQNIQEVPSAIGEVAGLTETTESVGTTTLLPVSIETLNGANGNVAFDSDMKVKSEDEAETVISIATRQHEGSETSAELVVSNSDTLQPSIQVSEQGMAASEMCIAASEDPEEVVPSGDVTDLVSPEPVPLLASAGNGLSEPMEQAVVEVVPQEDDENLKPVEENVQLNSEVLCGDQIGDITTVEDPQVQAPLLVTAGVGQQQQAAEQMFTEDGQTILYTNDGGQTFYQQATNMVVDQNQTQEMTMEASGPQFVSMETPEGLVEGQLVTNEDGTQFLIPHQETQEQAVYQTPEGLIVIQNPDGTLRIISNGDPQIPLEAVQALLAGESQIQVENTMEQAT